MSTEISDINENVEQFSKCYSDAKTCMAKAFDDIKALQGKVNGEDSEAHRVSIQENLASGLSGMKKDGMFEEAILGLKYNNANACKVATKWKSRATDAADEVRKLRDQTAKRDAQIGELKSEMKCLASLVEARIKALKDSIEGKDVQDLSKIDFDAADYVRALEMQQQLSWAAQDTVESLGVIKGRLDAASTSDDVAGEVREEGVSGRTGTSDAMGAFSLAGEEQRGGTGSGKKSKGKGIVR